MRRLLIVLVTIFAVFASGGAAVNSALVLSTAGSGGPAAIEAAETVDSTCLAGPAAHHHVRFKPCGKLRSGVLVTCHLDQGLLACPAELSASPAPPPLLAVAGAGIHPELRERLFRPPRMAALSRAA